MRFGVSELESFADCSQKWFVQRVLDPHDIDGAVDAKTRGSVAHPRCSASTRAPAAIGKDVVDAETWSGSRRSCTAWSPTAWAPSACRRTRSTCSSWGGRWSAT